MLLWDLICFGVCLLVSGLCCWTACLVVYVGVVYGFAAVLMVVVLRFGFRFAGIVLLGCIVVVVSWVDFWFDVTCGWC